MIRHGTTTLFEKPPSISGPTTDGQCPRLHQSRIDRTPERLVHPTNHADRIEQSAGFDQAVRHRDVITHGRGLDLQTTPEGDQRVPPSAIGGSRASDQFMSLRVSGSQLNAAKSFLPGSPEQLAGIFGAPLGQGHRRQPGSEPRRRPSRFDRDDFIRTRQNTSVIPENGEGRDLPEANLLLRTVSSLHLRQKGERILPSSLRRERQDIIHPLAAIQSLVSNRLGPGVDERRTGRTSHGQLAGPVVVTTHSLQGSSQQVPSRKVSRLTSDMRLHHGDRLFGITIGEQRHPENSMTMSIGGIQFDGPRRKPPSIFEFSGFQGPGGGPPCQERLIRIKSHRDFRHVVGGDRLARTPQSDRQEQSATGRIRLKHDRAIRRIDRQVVSSVGKPGIGQIPPRLPVIRPRLDRPQTFDQEFSNRGIECPGVDALGKPHVIRH